MSTPLHDRMGQIVGKRSYRAIGELTATHPETVRRYMQGASPSVEFLSAVCDQLGVNANWLLTGDGAMFNRDAKHEALAKADPSELLGSIASSLERIIQRVDRIELYVQTLEAKVAQSRAKGSPEREQATPIGPSRAGPGAVTSRARAIADVVSQRSRSDAD